MKQGRAELDILPLIDECDSMGKLFLHDSLAFKNYAKNDYNKLINAYGDQDWDLIDSSKQKIINNLKGGLVCYCYTIDEIVYSP